MSAENVEIVRRSFEHFVTTGEPDWELTHEQVEVRDHDIMDGRAYRGHDGVRTWLLEDWGPAWSEFSAEPEEYIDAGERVIAVFRIRAVGRGSGIEIERQDAAVYEVRDGLVARLDYYNNKPEALAAAGVEA